MGSSRLPGKSLMPLVGKPLFWHVWTRLSAAETVDEIVLATSDQAQDDTLEDYARSLGCTVVRGPADDVLARYVMAADAAKADIVVRVTGDCPLVDPWLVDYLVAGLAESDAGYVTVTPDGALIDEGIDPCRAWALRRLQAERGDDPVAREHVTSYFKHQPDFVPVVALAAPADRDVPGARLSVDTPADLVFLDAVYDRLGAAPGTARVADIVSLLRREPQLMRINGHVARKATETQAMKVLIRCDGDNAVGMGHVVRCVAIADALRSAHGAAVSFAVVTGTPAAEMIAAHGFRVEMPGTAQGDENTWLDGLAGDLRPDVLLVDVRSDLGPDTLRRIGARGVTVAVLDDAGPRSRAADIAFYPPLPRELALDWPAFGGDVRSGWDYIPMRRGFAEAAEARAARVAQASDGATPATPVRVLVSMGGADPTGATAAALRALSGSKQPLEIVAVLGHAFADHAAVIDAAAASCWPVEIRTGVEDMPGLMADMDCAIAAFGMTAYELAAVGVPALYVCATADHRRSAMALEQAGAAAVAGILADGPDAIDVDGARFGDMVRAFVGDRTAHRRMAAAARGLIDGRGAERIADVLAGLRSRRLTVAA